MIINPIEFRIKLSLALNVKTVLTIKYLFMQLNFNIKTKLKKITQIKNLIDSQMMH